MSNKKVDILLSSDSDYEELTVEIFVEGKFVALLNQDEGIENIKIEFPGIDVIENKILRKMDLSTLEDAISEAKQMVVREGSKQ